MQYVDIVFCRSYTVGLRMMAMSILNPTVEEREKNKANQQRTTFEKFKNLLDMLLQ